MLLVVKVTACCFLPLAGKGTSLGTIQSIRTYFYSSEKKKEQEEGKRGNSLDDMVETSK